MNDYIYINFGEAGYGKFPIREYLSDAEFLADNSFDINNYSCVDFGIIKFRNNTSVLEQNNFGFITDSTSNTNFTPSIELGNFNYTSGWTHNIYNNKHANYLYVSLKYKNENFNFSSSPIYSRWDYLDTTKFLTLVVGIINKSEYRIKAMYFAKQTNSIKMSGFNNNKLNILLNSESVESVGDGTPIIQSSNNSIIIDENDVKNAIPIPNTSPKATFYYNKCDKQHITKNIEAIAECSFIFKEPTNISNPVLKISGEEITNNILTKSNYVYIDKLKRYYYITDMRIVRNNLLEISCNVDVLMSFKEQILQQQAIIERNSNEFNTYLNDDEFSFQANPIIKTKKFPFNPFLNAQGEAEPKYLLTIAGSKQG